MTNYDICGYQLSSEPSVNNMMSRFALPGWYNSSYDEDHPNGSVSLHYVIFGGTAGRKIHQFWAVKRTIFLMHRGSDGASSVYIYGSVSPANSLGFRSRLSAGFQFWSPTDGEFFFCWLECKSIPSFLILDPPIIHSPVRGNQVHS